VIDGLDECDLDESLHYSSPRTKEDEQEEVLSILLRAVTDEAFPFRIILASRPEISIRRFFENQAANRYAEIFLDDKYNPDQDIALFLSSKFAELRQRHAHLPTYWPSEEDFDKLVRNASGQFIYAATVVRFISTPTNPPQVQLKIILQLLPPDSGGNPLGPLDALYTSILMSSPRPQDTALWLQAYRIILKRCRVKEIGTSAWVFDRFFESYPGQAQLILGLPSLIYVNSGRQHGHQSPDSITDGTYDFYHKAFLDFLGDRRRSKHLPDTNDWQIDEWICRRFGTVLQRMYWSSHWIYPIALPLIAR
jgi:hypothetical protein